MIDMDTRLLINFSYIGFMDDEVVLVHETDDTYYVDFWDEINAKRRIRPISSEDAEIIMRRARELHDNR